MMVDIAKYDGMVEPASVSLDHVVVHAQIHSILELYRDQTIVDQLAWRIGKVKSAEMSPWCWYEEGYVRVKMNIDVNKPLIRFVTFNMGGAGRKMLHVKYDKIGYFCDVCGILGHDMEECGDGVHGQEAI
jgi:hypothetical protein